MGRIFSETPSKFEIEFAGQVLQGVKSEQATGDLPATLFWHRMEFRFNLNEQRFSTYHPNISRMIKDAIQHRLELLPIPLPTAPICPVEIPEIPVAPPSSVSPQAVPEPATNVLFALGLVAVFASRIWSRGWGL